MQIFINRFIIFQKLKGLIFYCNIKLFMYNKQFNIYNNNSNKNNNNLFIKVLYKSYKTW